MQQDQVQPPVDRLERGETRLHLGLSTPDLGASIAFYRALFGSEPTKRRADYAKFEPEVPRVNLSLVERAVPVPETPGPAQHFGLQVDSAAALERIALRVRATGLEGRSEPGTTCCYGLQDKVWFDDPAGNAWEVYVLLADADQLTPDSGTCCVDAPGAKRETGTGCC